MFLILLFLLASLVFLYRGFHIVPHQEVWVVQRLGKFNRMLGPGLNWIIPMTDTVVSRHSLKEEAIEVLAQTAITQDNVSVNMDGIVYMKIVDPFAASYGVKNPTLALTQLVQTTMRSEIGKIPLDKTFEERETLNAKIVEAINEASTSWGIRCLRYEIKDIKMPEDIHKAMELQMTAERQKRARILESEGFRQSAINESEGQRQALINKAEGMKERIVLESQAARVDRVNRAKGEAEAILALAEASADGIERIAQALTQVGGEKAASIQIAEKYIKAFEQLAKEGTTVLLPTNLQQPASMIVEAMTIYDQLKGRHPYIPGKERREESPTPLGEQKN
ncbi:MAG: paraslipin [Verrucomicrobia bacterium]|nr:paraslipin [Verrucomicrobiota bacterium]